MPNYRLPGGLAQITVNGRTYRADASGLVTATGADAAAIAGAGGLVDGGAGSAPEWSLDATGTADGLIGPDGTKATGNTAIAAAALAGTNSRFVAPSGDTTGATDRAAINAAQAALGGAGLVQLSAATYYLDQPVVVSSGVKIVGCGKAATTIKVGSYDAFQLTGGTASALSGFNVTSISGTENTAGAALNFVSGSNLDASMCDVNVTKLKHAIKITAAALVTHFKIEDCAFIYNRSWHVLIEDAAVVNSITYNRVRFEAQTLGDGSYKATGSTYATGASKFQKCVFEGNDTQYAVDVGANPQAHSFDGCHFEANGGATDSGSDIRIVAGKGSVLLTDCIFAQPNASATNFYSIRKPDSGVQLTAIGVMASGTPTAGYLGLLFAPYTCNSTFIGTMYSYATFDYMTGAPGCVRISDPSMLTRGKVYDAMQVTAATTNATPAVVWSRGYISVGAGAYCIHYLIADIACIDDTGAVHASYTRRCTVKGNTATSALSILASTDETVYESDAGLDASFSVSTSDGGTIQLNVTGKAATNLRWTASIKHIESRS